MAKHPELQVRLATQGASARRLNLFARSLLAVLTAACVTLASVAASGGTSTAATTTASPHYSYSGSAFGTEVTVGSVVKSGRSAPVTLGCSSNGNLHRTNTTAGLTLSRLVTSGTVSTTADSYATPVTSSTTATTAQVNLLNGLVRATAVKAASSTVRTASGYEFSSSGTTFTGLVVAGRKVRADAAPNTRIALGGVGYVVVNEQVKQGNQLTVRGLRLVVTAANVLGILSGTTVVVSQAASGLAGPVAAVVGGHSFGTQVTVGALVSSGPSFVKYMPCSGTGGGVRSNTGAGVIGGPIGGTAAITNTVQGTVTASSTVAETTATVETADLLNGIVTASVITARARAATDGSRRSTSAAGSQFGSLRVIGRPDISADVAPNTRVDLPGVGTLYLHRVIRTERSVTVRMIELVVTSPVNGIAVGTNVQVGVAKAELL